MKKLAFAALLFALIGTNVVAADKNDPTGTWKLKSKIDNKSFEQTLKIKNADGTVTGVLVAGKQETKIEDGKFKDGELTFTTTQDTAGGKVVAKFSGKITGDAIKGSSTTTYKGKDYKSDFEGTREKK